MKYFQNKKKCGNMQDKKLDKKRQISYNIQ